MASKNELFASLVIFFFRRRTYCCSFFDYTYCGGGKEVGKEWNSRFIALIPFQCGLTSELAFALTTLCEMESNQGRHTQGTFVTHVLLHCTVVFLNIFICFVGNGKLGFSMGQFGAKDG